jgi:hypothetical protein
MSTECQNSNENVMDLTHDPLCRSREAPDDYWPEELCNCKFIAKVRADELRRPSEDAWMGVRAVLAWEDQIRADEQQKVARRLTGYHGEGCIGGTSGLGCGCGLWADVMTSSVEQP